LQVSNPNHLPLEAPDHRKVAEDAETLFEEYKRSLLSFVPLVNSIDVPEGFSRNTTNSNQKNNSDKNASFDFSTMGNSIQSPTPVELSAILEKYSDRLIDIVGEKMKQKLGQNH
jgi:hypothetical protein